MQDSLRMGYVGGGASGPPRAGSPIRLAGALLLALALFTPLLSACAPDAATTAQTNKTKLDNELTAATKAGVPARRLEPIIAQEDALAASTSGGSTGAYQTAATGYTTLYNQVVALTKQTPDQAQAQTTSDLGALKAALATAEGAGYADVTTAAQQFDPSVPVATQQLAAATTTRQYFAADGYILDQLAAVNLILPDYQQIQALTTLVNQETAALAGPQQKHVLECATEGGEIPSYGNVPAQFWSAQNDYPIAARNPVMVTSQPQGVSYYFSAWPTQALAAFSSARNADDFAALSVELQGQVATLTADANPAKLAHDQVAAAVARFQHDVDTYQAEAQANNAFLKSHRASAKDVPDYRGVWALTNNPNGYAPPDDFYPNVPDFQVDASFAQQATQDAQTLAAAKTSSDFDALTKTVQAQEQKLAFPLVKVEAFYDTNITLVALIAQGQSTTTNVTYAGTLYKTPNAYEYADDNLRYDKRDTVGIEDAQIRLDQSAYREGYVSGAEKMADYQAVENEAQMFIHNLSAMITNLAQMPKDNTARKAWSMTSHQTDIDLIDYYGLQNTKVIVVSLREQKARLYENGKLVIGASGKPDAFDVTTGSPDKPSPPGIHCALPPLKGPPGGDIFKSADPPGSPFYYNPTPVHFSFGYSLYGYYLHDGWWRDNTEMGYLTNLPHYDPAAFNGGSHGCINFHYSNGDMAKVFAFASVGIPIIDY